MTEQHKAMIRNAIDVLDQLFNGEDVVNGRVSEAISDLYTVIYENESVTKGSQSEQSDPLIFKFSDYYPKFGGPNGGNVA